MKEDCCVAGPPALWYLWLWILFYLGKGPGTQWHRRGAKQQHGDNNNEHFRITQCIAMRFWSILICVLIWYWNSGFSWRSSWNVSGSGMLRSLLHPIWWNATKVWKPFTIWPRGYRGGWSSRPCDKQCRAVVHWFMLNQREVHRCTAWALSPFFHRFERNWFRLWGCLLILEKNKMRWVELCWGCRVFFSMLVGSHNKLVVIGTWHCSPKPGLLGSGPSGKSQTQLEKHPAKPVCSDQFFPMSIFL